MEAVAKVQNFRGTVLVAAEPGGFEVYGTKATTKLIKRGKKEFSKRGFGWSGCTQAAEPGKFWVASDNYKKSIFRIDFTTGVSEKFKLSHPHGNLEGMSTAPGLWDDSDVFFINTSCSINKMGQTMDLGSSRNRLSLCRLPLESVTSASGKVRVRSKNKTYHFKGGENMFVWEDVSYKVLSKFAEQALMDPTAPNYLNCVVDCNLPAKKGGLDIEGIAFVHADVLKSPYNEDPKAHILYLGCRGPVTRDHCALLVPVFIPKNTFTDPDTWSVGYAHPLDLGGFGIRDMHFDAAQKKIVMLSGPLFQDKGKQEFSQYPLFAWDIFRQPRKPTQVGWVPRLLNGKLQGVDQLILPLILEMLDPDTDSDEEDKGEKKHKKPKDTLKEHQKEALETTKEKERHMSSPEGICGWNNNSQLLICWDHNDMGPYALVPYPDLSGDSFATSQN
eukprot:TRINITY_DN2482_c0_g1_i1.p1 TRINITY_DN2482_c0_g1~~TRINITY_DN2482_c0_g1_i1.p1  ORF type:complete len:445 (-),score=80.33 TRINITY_DN2482_c0_g1_i1:112-1446(-)